MHSGKTLPGRELENFTKRYVRLEPGAFISCATCSFCMAENDWDGGECVYLDGGVDGRRGRCAGIKYFSGLLKYYVRLTVRMAQDFGHINLE